MTGAIGVHAPPIAHGRGIRRLGGRPTTLTPELSAQIVALVGDVGALATAARCAGVPVRVAREWLARGLGNDPDRRPTSRPSRQAERTLRARRIRFLRDKVNVP
jgi:hypothetical protein